MTNDHYLLVSYFVVGFVSLCLGVAAYRVFRKPFAAIAERVAGKSRSLLLKRALAASMTLAGVLGFLSFSYTQKGCMNYEQVVKDRDYLVQANREQLQHAGNWIAAVVFVWSAVVLICLVMIEKKNSEPGDQP